MVKCTVKNCPSRSGTHNKATGITFHSIPRDPVRRAKWTKAIQLLRKETDWIPSNFTKICSKHFRDQDKIGLNNDTGRIHLSHNAIPMLDDDPKLDERDESSQSMDIDRIEDDVIETDEEIEEITESPRKRKMRQTIKRLKEVSSNRLKKIKKLIQRNKRLEKKNKKLLDVIYELKTKLDQ